MGACAGARGGGSYVRRDTEGLPLSFFFFLGDREGRERAKVTSYKGTES